MAGPDCTDVDVHGTEVEALDGAVEVFDGAPKVFDGALEVFAGAVTEAAGDMASAVRFQGVGGMTSSSLSSASGLLQHALEGVDMCLSSSSTPLYFSANFKLVLYAA